MKERSLVMVKPDAVMDGHDDEIKMFLVSKGMTILQEASIWFTAERLQAFYQVSIPADSFAKMVELYSKSFAIVFVFEGESALKVGQEAKKCFRQKYYYGYYGSTIHATDTPEEFDRETLCLLANDRRF